MREYSPPTQDEIRQCLRALPASAITDRRAWLYLCRCVHGASGGAAWAQSAFVDWSRDALGGDFNATMERGARQAWRDAPKYPALTMGTLITIVRDGIGNAKWLPQRKRDLSCPPEVAKAIQQHQRKRDMQRRWQQEDAEAAEKERENAAHAIQARKFAAFPKSTHQYWQAKGLSGTPISVVPPTENEYQGWAVIPAYHMDSIGEGCTTDDIASVQLISPDGKRKIWLAGGDKRRLVLPLYVRCTGNDHAGAAVIFCEGIATAVSIHRALMMKDDIRAIIISCFSESNLRLVATEVGRGLVIADNDRKGAGQRAAQSTGLPYWMPPDVGTDADDFRQMHGDAALAEELNAFISKHIATHPRLWQPIVNRYHAQSGEPPDATRGDAISDEDEWLADAVEREAIVNDDTAPAGYWISSGLDHYRNRQNTIEGVCARQPANIASLVNAWAESLREGKDPIQSPSIAEICRTLGGEPSFFAPMFKSQTEYAATMPSA